MSLSAGVTMSRGCPPATASCRDVQPLAVLTLTSAPCSIRSPTISLPARTAIAS